LENLKAGRDRSGFTLIEILVVVALLGLIFTFALPRLNSHFRLSLETATREIASTIKDAFNSTMVTRKVHRLAIDFGEKKYWVEKQDSAQSGEVLLHTESSLEKKREQDRWKSEDEKKAGGVSFALAADVTPKKKSLPDGVEFSSALSEQYPEPIKEGIATFHFFPHGLSEQGVIHIKDLDGHEFTLVISAVMGKTKLLRGNVSKEEIYGEK